MILTVWTYSIIDSSTYVIQRKKKYILIQLLVEIRLRNTLIQLCYWLVYEEPLFLLQQTSKVTEWSQTYQCWARKKSLTSHRRTLDRTKHHQYILSKQMTEHMEHNSTLVGIHLEISKYSDNLSWSSLSCLEQCSIKVDWRKVASCHKCKISVRSAIVVYMCFTYLSSYILLYTCFL